MAIPLSPKNTQTTKSLEIGFIRNGDNILFFAVGKETWMDRALQNWRLLVFSGTEKLKEEKENTAAEALMVKERYWIPTLPEFNTMLRR